jgi:predicted metal-dependent hydrolase
MPNKQFMFDDDLQINVYKRKSNRSLRLSISATGEVRVSIPAWAPYSAGVNFAKSRQQWIVAQRQPRTELIDGQPVGKAHHLRFQVNAKAQKTSSRLRPGEVVVSHPPALTSGNPAVQKVARTASIRALRAQAEQLLPQRLASLAAAHDFTYANVSVKQLKSRWGSCDQHKNIVLNLFLMQLPWEYIDYVLLHELTHTRVLRHGPDFWQVMKAVLPNVTQIRKELRAYQPVLAGSPPASVPRG